MPRDPKDPDREKKALTWRERMDPETAGRRWDPDTREGMSQRKPKKGTNH